MNVRELMNELEKYPAGATVLLYTVGEKIDPPNVLKDGSFQLHVTQVSEIEAVDGLSWDDPDHITVGVSGEGVG